MTARDPSSNQGKSRRGLSFGLRPALHRLALLATALTAASASAQPLFQGLGDLPGGFFDSSAWTVSADGSVVIGMSSSGSNCDNYDQQAFRWTAEEGMVGLGRPDRPGCQATGISTDGSLITGWFPSFLWTAEGGTVYSTDPGWEWLQGCNMAVSADGSVLVGAKLFRLGHGGPALHLGGGEAGARRSAGRKLL